mmetsp:Transcript_48725/g.152941  ORF Transcript_48725/g.152941 Transcript_48725/m.152941 type:complete len:436 (+) Transcript_48725:1674-2981(+)
MVHQDINFDPSCPELLVADLEDFLKRVVAGNEVAQAEVLPQLSQAVGPHGEQSHEDEDGADLEVEVGEEGSIVLRDEVAEVASLPHAAAVVTARLAHLLLLDVAAGAARPFLSARGAEAEAVSPLRHNSLLVPHDAGREDGDLEEVVENDADRRVGAEVAQGWKSCDGPKSEGEHVCHARQRDRRPCALHHVRNPVLKAMVSGSPIQRACQHEHVVHANTQQDEGEQSRHWSLRDVCIAADPIGGADCEPDGRDAGEGDGGAAEHRVELAEDEDGVNYDERDANVELDDVAPDDSAQHPTDRALYLDVGLDVLALLVPLLHLLQELPLPHQCRVAALLALGVCDRVVAVGVSTVCIVGPGREPGHLQRVGTDDLAVLVLLPSQQLLAIRDVQNNRLLAVGRGEDELGRVDPGEQLGVGVDQVEVEAMAAHVVHEL